MALHEATGTFAIEAEHGKDDWLTMMMDFEDGSLSEEQTIKLFQHLVDNGQAWQLQGMYGRMAQRLIDAGKIKAAARHAKCSACGGTGMNGADIKCPSCNGTGTLMEAKHDEKDDYLRSSAVYGNAYKKEAEHKGMTTAERHAYGRRMANELAHPIHNAAHASAAKIAKIGKQLDRDDRAARANAPDFYSGKKAEHDKFFAHDLHKEFRREMRALVGLSMLAKDKETAVAKLCHAWKEAKLAWSKSAQKMTERADPSQNNAAASEYGGSHWKPAQHEEATGKFAMAAEMGKTDFGTLTPEGKVKNLMSIDLNKVKSDDPLAYAYGFSQGRSGQPMSKDKGLAPEYVRGYKEGKSGTKEAEHKCGGKIEENMKKEYGAEKGEEVYYASKNKGIIKG